MNRREWDRAEHEMLLAAAELMGWASSVVTFDRPLAEGVRKRGREIIDKYEAAAARRAAALTEGETNAAPAKT